MQLVVTPCVGVWIETLYGTENNIVNIVTPCVGVWIETFIFVHLSATITSHPAWVCGLKH